MRRVLTPLRGARSRLHKLLRAAMRTGDPVIYRSEPGLYGLMTVYMVRQDGRVVCSLLPRDAELEVFDRYELEQLTPETAPKC